MQSSPKGWQTSVNDVLRCASARTRTLVILVILAGLAFLTLRNSNEADFVLVIDSGSTGTRIFAYRWQEQPGQPPLVTVLEPKAAQQKVPRKAAGDVRAYERVETEFGLDKFVHDPSGLWTTALQPLLAWAEAVVPRSQWSATPLFLLGTAGLRVLSPDSQTKLLSNVQRSLEASVFRFEPAWAKVISGKDEGIYGWIALNYLTGHLAANAGQAVNITVLGTDYSLYAHVHHSYGLNDAFDRSVAHLLSARQLNSNTESALQDSVQQKPLDQDDTAVAAEATAEAAPEDRRLAQDESLLAATAADRAALEATWPAQHESLHADITAGMEHAGGRQLESADAAADREAADGGRLDTHGSSASVVAEPSHRRHLLANLEDNTRGSATVTQHDQAEQSIQLLSSHVATHGIARRETSSSSHLAAGARRRSMLQEGVQGSPLGLSSFALQCRPDWNGCKALAAAVVNASQPCPASLGDGCALGVSQPVTSQQMYALTGFFVVLKFLHLPSDASLAELEAAGQDFCGTPWSAINLSRGLEIHVDRYCFRVPYVIQLLTEGLGLPEAQVTVGSGREGWTLGAALAEGSKALQRSSRSSLTPGTSHMRQPTLWVLAAVFAALSLALFLYLFCFQSAAGGLADVRLGQRESSSPWYNSSETAQTQDRLVLRVPSPSPFSSMEPVTALRAASLGGKCSPPPFRQGNSRQHGQASMPRMPSLASGGHRKRQLSFSSLSLDTLDTE